MEDFNPDDEPKEPKREEEEESDLVGHEKLRFINAWFLDSYPLFFSHLPYKAYPVIFTQVISVISPLLVSARLSFMSQIKSKT